MGTRSDQARQAALEATLGLLADGGLERFTIEAVAQRSGVAKTTIYRHWPTKVDLVVDALTSAAPTWPTPNTGDVREDVAWCLRSLRDHFMESSAPRITCALLAASWHDADLEDLHERLSEQRSRPLQIALELAQLRGQIPAELDVEELTSIFAGPLIGRALILQVPVSDGFIDLVVDTVLAGLRAGTLGPASGARQ